MNERLIINPSRQTTARNANAEQSCATAEQHEHTAQCAAQQRKCGLDTGARGWRYVYQTH